MQAMRSLSDKVSRLPTLSASKGWTAQVDWLINPSGYQAKAYRTPNSNEIALSNGLITRTFRVAPNGATVGFDNLMTNASVIRGVKPEALLTVGGIQFEVGGLRGQPNYAYLLSEWIGQLQPDPRAFRLVGFEIEGIALDPFANPIRHDVAGVITTIDLTT